MNDLRLTETEISFIKEMVRHKGLAIIWDANAFYFNVNACTYKLECEEAQPEGSNWEYDEIFYCRFYKLPHQSHFDDDNAEYFYSVLSKNKQICSIDLINITQLFPGGHLISTAEIQNHIDGLNYLNIGLVITTCEGQIPAFLLPSQFGFVWQQDHRFYEENEVNLLLKTYVKIYDRIPLTF